MKNTKIFLLLMIITMSLLTAFAAAAQTETLQLLGTTESGTAVSKMVWNETGDVLTLVARDSVQRFAVSSDPSNTSYTLGDGNYFFTTVSEAGVCAMVSKDMNTIYLFDPDSPEKEIRTIEPGFKVLSVSVSKDGTLVLADSADQIRSVIYDTADGSQVYDLSGFHTAAPVYDSVLSDDQTCVLWHSRGTFALQNIADGSIGKTISLWDFASSYELSPDNSLLAVGIINDDYENGAVIFFDPLSGEEKGRTLTGTQSPFALSFSEDGSVLWAADAQNIYKIDTADFTVLSQTSQDGADDEDRFLRIASAPDGNTAAVLTSGGKLFLVR